MEVSDDAVAKKVKEILERQDLEKITTKDVFAQLELELGCDLSGRKHLIRQKIENLLTRPPSDDEVGENAAAVPAVEMFPGDDSEEEMLQRRIKRALEESLPRIKKKPLSKRKRRRRVIKVVETDPATIPVKLTKALREFLDTIEIKMTRLEVTKRVWQYIRDMDLQKYSDSSMIVCDEKLKKLLDCDEFSGLGHLPQLLKAHFIE